MAVTAPTALIGPTVYVIRPDGKVSYRDLGLEPQDKREFESLKRAVAKAAQP